MGMNFKTFVLLISFSFGILPHVTMSKYAVDPERLNTIDVLIAQAIDEGLIPGASVLIAQGESIEKFTQYGTMDLAQKPVKEDTIFRLYSMTKPITNVATLILYERSAFFLNDRIDTLWPAMKDLQIYESGSGDEMVTRPVEKAPTVMDLMMHTAGFYYPWDGSSPNQELGAEGLPSHGQSIVEVSERIAKYPILFEPSERWNYGYSHDILAGLVEYVSGVPFDEFISQEILEPLGMADTAYQVSSGDVDRLMNLYELDDNGRLSLMETGAESEYLKPDPVSYGGSGLTGTALDYFQFCRMLLSGGKHNGARILSTPSVDYMLQNHLREDQLPFNDPESPYGRFTMGNGFGLGVKVIMDASEQGNIGSPGEAAWSGAASTYFWVVPEHDITILFFTQNRSYLAVQPLAEKIRLAAYHALSK